MIEKFLTLRIISRANFWLVLFVLFFIKNSFSEGVSSELHYRWVSDSTYEFTYVYWQYASAGTGIFPDTFHYNVSSASLGISVNQSCSTNCLLPTSGQGIPILQPDGLTNCSDRAYTDTNHVSVPYYDLYFQEKVFRFQHTFSAKARDWVISIKRWNSTVLSTNIINFVDYAECGINNLDIYDSVAKNISPIWMERRSSIPGYLNRTFINYPVISVCNGRTYTLDQSVAELQGDEIRYEFPRHGKYIDTGFNAGGARYLWGFNLDYLLPTDTPPKFNIDPVNGKIGYKPVEYAPPIHIPSSYSHYWNKHSTNFYSFPIMAREFRYDTVIIGGNPTVRRVQLGYITRFITVVATPDSLCADSNTVFADTTNGNPTTFISLNCSDNPFKIAFNNTIRCNTIDSNGSSFLLINNQNGDTINIMKAEPECRHDNISDRINITLDSALNNGFYSLIVKKGDDGNSFITQCGSEVILTDTLLVQKNTGPDPEMFYADSTLSNSQPIELECRSWGMTFFTSFDIGCHTVDANGSDFYLIDSISMQSVVLDSANVSKCKSGFGNKIDLHFKNQIYPGNYTLYLKSGTDGNTIVDRCHREWSVATLKVNVSKLTLDIGQDYKFCSRDTFSVNLSLDSGKYGIWNTGEYRNNITTKEFGTYWVRVYSKLGCSATDTVKIIPLNCTGIDEHTINSIKVYPNPTSGRIQVELNDLLFEQIQIYNDQGSKVFKQNISGDNDPISIDLPNALNDGIYLIEFIGNETVFRQKFILKKMGD